MWRTIPGQSLQFRAWEDEFVLYNDLSGDTHLLGAGAIHVLLALKASPLDEGALAMALHAALPPAHPTDGEAGSEGADGLADLLASLAALSLIEPVACPQFQR